MFVYAQQLCICTCEDRASQNITHMQKRKSFISNQSMRPVRATPAPVRIRKRAREISKSMHDKKTSHACLRPDP